MDVVPETVSQQAAIRQVAADAFGRQAEADLVDALRREGDLAVSLVVLLEDEVCGHVALSRLKSPNRSLALAPVSVPTARQRRGIGSALIRAAIDQAQELKYDIVFVLGDPVYYRRFGFSISEAARFPSPYAGPHFMALRLGARSIPPAPVVYADAFARLE